MKYLPRTADRVLTERLETFGAVLIEGPKWTGKTTTAMQQSQSVLKLQDPDHREENLVTASTMPSLLLKGKQPRLIDEWQDAPMLWDAVRTFVDNSGGKPGQFILTGSNTIDKSKIYHTGTGRISRMKMYPMSLWESQESSGEVSLKELFDNPAYDIDGAASKLDIPTLIRAACRGGWPVAITMSEKAGMLIASDYVNTLCDVDISSIDGKRRNPKIARQIMRSYARNISTIAKRTSILADITSSGEISLSLDTFDDYVRILESLFVIQDIDAWCPSIRSKTAIRSMPKRGFCDPSIAAASMGVNAIGLETQLKTFGFIFEQMCARDLRAYTPGFGSHLSYYRDRYGLEADLVLHLDDGRYALIECKLGSREIEDGAKHLLEIKRLIQVANQTEKQAPLREPDLLVILTGGSIAYTRPDGVKVVPLACLKD
ncbi:MAG: ATP-binding protein [Bacteroidaceae bacterium]